MPEPLDLEIRDRLTRYLAGELSLEQFEDWFVPASWDVHLSGNRLAEELAYDIEAVLAQASTERWPEERIRERLLAIIRDFPVHFAGPPRQHTG